MKKGMKVLAGALIGATALSMFPLAALADPTTEGRYVAITISTKDTVGSGTDGDVYARFHYNDGSVSEKTLLDKPFYNDFEAGDIDTYDVYSSRSDILSVDLIYDFTAWGLDAECQWVVDWVKIDDTLFAVNKTFDRKQDEDGNYIETDEDDIYNIRLSGTPGIEKSIVIYTGQNRPSVDAGTYGYVYAEFNFVDGTRSGKIELDISGYEDFRAGAIDTYDVVIDNKEVQSITFSTLYGGDWLLAAIDFNGAHYDLDTVIYDEPFTIDLQNVAKYYTVTLDSGYGVTKPPILVEAGTGYKLPSSREFPAPSDDAVFSSWEINGKRYAPFNKVQVNENMTVTAIWR